MENYKIKELLVKNGDAILKQEITLDGSYFTKILKLENIDINNFVKVLLPKDKVEAKDILTNGFIYKDNKYKYFITSPSLLKKDNGQVLFIKEDVQDFKEKFENIVSLNKLVEMKNKKYLNINKDIISRASLALSSSKIVDVSNFKILVLPELEYKYTANYLQFKSINGLDKEIDLDNFKLEEHPNKTLNHIANDGAGFATPRFFKHLQKELELKHNLSWITFRTIGNAGKGLLVNFNYKQYYKDIHNLDKVEVIDAWGTPQNLMEFDIVLNKSQIKWLNNFNSKEEFYKLVESSKYKDLYNTIGVCKHNKKESKLHTSLNYQILSNLALNHKLLEELAKEDIRVYESIIKDKDKDLIRLLLGDVVREEQDALSSTTKIHKLIQLNEDFTKTKTAKYLINQLVDKKINNLAGLDITTVAEYKTVVQDPISYFDSIAFLKDEVKISQNGLKKETVYIRNEVGNRVVARCPLNSSTEILKRQTVQNKLLDKYLLASTDLIVYALDNTLMLQSGADADGDIICIIDNEIIYNAVIEDIDEKGNKWHFNNQFDGNKAKDVLYTDENTILNILNSRGNLIGKYSNYGAILSDMNLQIPYKNKEGKIASYQKLIKGLSNSYKKSKELFNKHLEESTFKLMDEAEYDERIIEIANKNFQENKIWSYYLLYLQMVLIDQPKTGIAITKEMEDKLKESKLTYLKKPLYIYYSKYKKENRMVKYEDCIWTNSSLTNFTKSVIKRIGFDARKESSISSKGNSIIFKIMEDIDAEVDNNLLEKLTSLYNKYNNTRNKVPEDTLVKIVKNDPVRLAELRLERDRKFDEIDIEIFKEYLEITSNIDNKVLLRTIADIRTSYKGNKAKLSSNFIIKFVFDNLVKHMLEINNKATAYVLDNENGDIQFFYNKYRKVEGILEQDNLAFKEIQRKKEKHKLIKKTRIKIVEHNKLTSIIKVKDNVIFNNEGEILGNIFNLKEDKGKFLLEDGTYNVDSYEFKTRKIDKYEQANNMSIYVEVA